MKVFLIEDSTSHEVPQNLEVLLSSLVESLPSADRNEIMCVLLYVLMIETGFIPQNVMICDFSNADHNFNIQTLNKLCCMPNNWKNYNLNIYELLFHLGKFTSYPCKLVIIPVDDMLIVNLLISNFIENKDKYSITIQPSKYVKNLSDAVANSFKNLKELSLEFKNKMTQPARAAILTQEGILNSSLLGIPDELKIRILKKLDKSDLINVCLVCQDLYRVCQDQSLKSSPCHQYNRMVDGAPTTHTIYG